MAGHIWKWGPQKPHCLEYKQPQWQWQWQGAGAALPLDTRAAIRLVPLQSCPPCTNSGRVRGLPLHRRAFHTTAATGAPQRLLCVPQTAWALHKGMCSLVCSAAQLPLLQCSSSVQACTPWPGESGLSVWRGIHTYPPIHHSIHPPTIHPPIHVPFWFCRQVLKGDDGQRKVGCFDFGSLKHAF